MIARVAAVWLAASLGGCTWFDAGPPGRACKIDRECFRAQGEVCDPISHTCVDRVDAGPIDAAAAIDAPELDAELDATVAGAPP